MNTKYPFPQNRSGRFLPELKIGGVLTKYAVQNFGNKTKCKDKATIGAWVRCGDAVSTAPLSETLRYVCF